MGNTSTIIKTVLSLPTSSDLQEGEKVLFNGNEYQKVKGTVYKIDTGIDSTVIIVKTASDFGTIDSTKVYVIDGVIDMGTTSIEIPSGGITIQGYDFNNSKLTSSENTYTLFTSPIGGSGDVLIQNMSFEITGTSSKVFEIVSDTGNEAIEINRVNFNDCTSLGSFENYRQVLEQGTGRLGGTPELELIGAMSGYRLDTSIAFNMSNFTSLFKAGTGLTFSGRFILGINCDLPGTGALFDFSDTNITNDESLQIVNTRVTRSGTLDASDTTIYPNINETNVKSLWSNNTGITNTYKYIKANITTEVATTVSVINTYYALAGTFTVDTSSHFDMPSNGEFRLLSGNGIYQVTGDFVLEAGANNEIDIRVTKSTDDGATYPTEINHIKRTVNNLSGGRDVAFFPINFIANLKENDRIRIEVENKTNTTNITGELDSYLIISQI